MNKKQRIIDEELVLEYQSGNKEVLTLLVKRWHKTFCKKAYWILKDADIAKDVAQDSWKTIIDNLNELKDVSSFAAWALRIVYNKSLDVINTNKRINKAVESFRYKEDKESENNNESIKNALLEAIKKLPEHQQTVIRLFYVQDYSLKEISDILNTSVGTVKSRLFHARETLKKTLKNKNYEN